MPDVTVRYYASLRNLTGQEENNISARRVRDAINFIKKNYDRRVVDHLAHCSIFINNTSIIFLNGLNTRLKDGDTIHIFPPLAGG
jgi:MoaD family protein